MKKFYIIVLIITNWLKIHLASVGIDTLPIQKDEVISTIDDVMILDDSKKATVVTNNNVTIEKSSKSKILTEDKINLIIQITLLSLYMITISTIIGYNLMKHHDKTKELYQKLKAKIQGSSTTSGNT